MSDPVLARLAGQCASGAERDGGARIHAVVAGRGVCGAMPGRRSVGWIEVDGAEQPTCPRCIAGLRTANLDALRLRRRDAREVEHRGRTIVHKAAGCWILHAGPGLPKNLRFRTLKAAKRAVDLVARNDAPPAAELLASSSPGRAPIRSSMRAARGGQDGKGGNMTDAKLDQVLLALVKAATFTGMRAKPAGVARHFGVPLKQAQRAVRRLRARGVAC